MTIRPALGGTVNVVPEPSTFVVLSAGAIALLGFIGRRRRASA